MADRVLLVKAGMPKHLADVVVDAPTMPALVANGMAKHLAEVVTSGTATRSQLVSNGMSVLMADAFLA